MTAWWLGLAPAQTTVDCHGQAHRLRWTDGGLRSLDHDDIDGERALAALGGERCPCVDLVGRWERHVCDLRVLALGSRGPSDLLRLADSSGPPSFRAARGATAMSLNAGSAWASSVSFGPTRGAPLNAAAARVSPRPAPFPSAATQGFAGSSPAGRTGPARAAGDDLLGLLGLGGGLADRLQATVIATWAERIAARPPTATPDSEAELAAAMPRLSAALHGRLASSLRSWLGQVDLELDLELIAAGATPSITRTSPTRLGARLPFAWLGDVWCRGLATVMGRFCIAAATSDGRDWTLSTLAPELGPAETVAIRLVQPCADGR